MYTDIGTRVMGSTASPPVPQSVAAATTAGLLSEHWMDLLEGIRSQDLVARSLGEGLDLVANFDVIASLTAATANVTCDLQIVALPRTSLAAVAVVAANATETFTLADHGLENGTCITIGGTPPAGLGAAGAVHYFVVNKTTNTFQVSTTPGGAVAAFTDDGTSPTITVIAEVIGASGPIPLKRLAAGFGRAVRINPLGTSTQQPRHRYVFTRVVPSANLTGGSMVCDITHDYSNERLFYPSGQIA